MRFTGTEPLKTPDIRQPESRYTYTCGHCNTKVSGIVVSVYETPLGTVKWVLCTDCGYGSVLNDGSLYPSMLFGPIIEGLPQEVKEAYQEARNCMSVRAYTACELLCRKILMHVSVEKGAKEKETFASYLTFLSEQGYITPPMTKWVSLIREHGGKATHLIEKPEKKRAESTLMFTAELLRLIYEMEHMASQYIAKTQPEKET
ncbi:MAG: DUF4145 domain-containing protein [Dehalococcoidia bacterium]|nr:MAG: DUF4145 domain-containing protein [Dehalococcoidia bacterium]